LRKGRTREGPAKILSVTKTALEARNTNEKGKSPCWKDQIEDHRLACKSGSWIRPRPRISGVTAATRNVARNWQRWSATLAKHFVVPVAMRVSSVLGVESAKHRSSSRPAVGCVSPVIKPNISASGGRIYMAATPPQRCKRDSRKARKYWAKSGHQRRQSLALAGRCSRRADIGQSVPLRDRWRRRSDR
jgi:hypothetical protein